MAPAIPRCSEVRSSFMAGRGSESHSERKQGQTNKNQNLLASVQLYNL